MIWCKREPERKPADANMSHAQAIGEMSQHLEEAGTRSK